MTDKNPERRHVDTLSVVIPVYNLEGWLDACFASLAAQSDQSDRWEVVAVDDGSTDATPAALDDWARRLGGRLSVHRIPHGGVNSARRFGLAHAKGDYVWFVDGDDVIHPRAVELYLSLFARHPDVQMWQHRFVWGERIRFGDLPTDAPVTVFREDVSAIVQLSLWEFAFKADFIRGQPFPDFLVGEDILFAGRQLARARTVATVECELYGYVTRPTSITHQWTFARLSGQIRADLELVRFYAGEGARLNRNQARGLLGHLLFGTAGEFVRYAAGAERRELCRQWRSAVIAAHGLAQTRALDLAQRIDSALLRLGFPSVLLAALNAFVFQCRLRFKSPAWTLSLRSAAADDLL